MARRTLNDGLTPEQETFLSGGAAKPPSPGGGNLAMPQGGASVKADSGPPAASVPAIGMVGLHTRIDAGLHNGLLKAAMDRKLARRPAATVQDIVGEALTEWLKKAGYLG